MKTTLISILVLLVGIFLQTGEAQERIRLTVIAEKNQFQLGEPVIVYTEITNLGTQPIMTFGSFGPEIDEYIYFITNPAGESKRFAPAFVEEVSETVTLQRNQSVGGPARIFFGANGYAFNEPGSYGITVRYRDTQSTPLTIQITAPADDAQREQALLILGNPEVGLFLMFEGGDELSSALENINTLIGRFPNSPHAHYLKYALGKNYSVPARNFVSGNHRPADHARASEILSGLRNSPIQLYYLSKAYIVLAQSLTALERKEEADSVMRELQEIIRRRENVSRFFQQQTIR